MISAAAWTTVSSVPGVFSGGVSVDIGGGGSADGVAAGAGWRMRVGGRLAAGRLGVTRVLDPALESGFAPADVFAPADLFAAGFVAAAFVDARPLGFDVAAPVLPAPARGARSVAALPFADGVDPLLPVRAVRALLAEVGSAALAGPVLAALLAPPSLAAGGAPAELGVARLSLRR